MIDERIFINDFLYNKFYLQELSIKNNKRKISILRNAHARVSYCTAVLPTWTVSERQRPTSTALNRRFGEPRLCGLHRNVTYLVSTKERSLEGRGSISVSKFRT